MGVRTLIFVRHGQYERDPKEQLTDLGRAQAEVVSARLAFVRADSVVSSMMPRAKETAGIIARHQPSASKRAMRLLNERLTYQPRFSDPPWAQGHPEEMWAEGHDRVERAHGRLFRGTRGADRVEIYAFHGNMIRTLVCRAMSFPVEAWIELGIHHCGVTQLRVHPRYGVRLEHFNDIGHLPPAMRTEQ